ncbi:MAG: WD40 repeat domain-containing protein, partial [Gemmataceae bacterium]
MSMFSRRFVTALALLSGSLAVSAASTAEPAPEKKPRLDRYGDALPPHAIARLGTRRFRGVRRSLAFSPDGKWLASETERGVTLWEAATGRTIRQFAAPGRHLSFSADGKRLACSATEHCHIFDVSNGKKLFTVEGARGIFADDGKTLVTANAFISPSRVHVWDARTGKQLRRWAAGEWIEELAVSADGRMAAWINTNKPVVHIRDLENGALKHTIPVIAKRPSWLAFTADGKMLAIANGRQVCLWNIATGKQVRRWDQRSDSHPVFSRDGRRLAWTGYDEQMGIARIWTVQRDEAAPHAVGAPVNSFEPPCLSPDSKVIAVLTDGHALQLRRLSDGKEVRPLDAHDSQLDGVVFTRDGRHVVSECRTGVFVWETHTGRLVRRAPDTEWRDNGFMRLLPGGRLLTTNEERHLLTVRDM